MKFIALLSLLFSSIGAFSQTVNLSNGQTLTTNQKAAVVTALGLPAANVITQKEVWVCEGDSWTAGTAQGNDRECWPYYLARFAEVSNKAQVINVATAGQTAQTMVGTFASQVTPNLTATTGRPSVAFIFAGINDGGSRTTNQVRDDLRTMWTAARTAGAKVVAFTLPHRTANGGWSQSNWAAVNAQIIADSSYYDTLIRTDVIFSNANSSEFADGLHVSTAAQKKFAGQIFTILNGGNPSPSLPSDVTCGAVSSITLTGNTQRNLSFTETYDNNSDMSQSTVGSDANTNVFTAPIDGTYDVQGGLLLGAVASGDSAWISLWVVPIATGTAVEHRLFYNVASGTSMGLTGGKRLKLLRGDTVYLSVTCSKTGAAPLTNANFSAFNVRLLPN